jgi:hypothetical protein
MDENKAVKENECSCPHCGKTLYFRVTGVDMKVSDVPYEVSK